MKIYWTCKQDINVWYEASPGRCDSMYFPKAEWFLENYPWLAVRIFWICIKIKEILIEYSRLGHFNYF